MSSNFVLPLLFSLLLLPATHCYNFTLDIPMRDGVTLYTVIFVPDNLPPGTRVGTVLIRTPYSTFSQTPLGQVYSEIGWACAVADERGKYNSGGLYTMWASASNDTADTIAFLSDQPWSNHLFAWTGASANAIMGYVEPLTSPTQGRMKAQYNMVGTARLKGLAYQGGAYREELISNWLVQQNSPQFVDIVKAHETFSDYWVPTTALPGSWENYTWPSMHLAGWYDIFSTLQIQDALSLDVEGGAGARNGQIVVVEPNGHCIKGGAVPWPNASWGSDFTSNYSIALFEEALGAPVASSSSLHHAIQAASNAKSTMDSIRKSVGVGAEGTVFVWYVMGSGGPKDLGNLWTAGPRDFFLNSTYHTLYLSGDGGLQVDPPSPSPPTKWQADPSNPIPTLGGNTLTLPLCGPQDQRPVQSQHGKDIAPFSTAPFNTPLFIHGEVLVNVGVSSSAKDTDVHAKLMDVYPTGETMLLVDGVVRMRGRGGVYEESFSPPLKAGQVYNVTVSLGWFSYIVTQGHALRLDLSSSNFPRFSVNPNTGQPISNNSSAPVVASNSVYHDPSHPSTLLLPLFDLGATQLKWL